MKSEPTPLQKVLKWILIILALVGFAASVFSLDIPGKYLTGNPWDLLFLILILSPAIPAVLYLFFAKSKDSMVGKVSPLSQILIPFWMVKENLNLPHQTLWQVILMMLLFIFGLMALFGLGFILIPMFIDFMAIHVFS